MSYFSNQLQVTIELLNLSRAQFAELTGVPPTTLHKFWHNVGRGPEAAVLEKICGALEDEKIRADLVIAHLRDEMPSNAADLVRIVSLVHGSKVQEEPSPRVHLPKSVREDFEFMQAMAAKHPEVVESLRATVKLIRGI